MAVLFREIDEFENRCMNVGFGVDEFEDREAQDFVHDDRQRMTSIADERREIPIQSAAHLDGAVGQLRCEGAVARIEVGLARAVLERFLRSAFRRVGAGRREDVAHDHQRDGACVHGFPAARLCRYAASLMRPRLGAMSSSMASEPSGAT